MTQPPNSIRTKLGQPPSSSPRTLENKRRQLGSLFSSLTLTGPSETSSNVNAPTRPSRLFNDTDPQPSSSSGSSPSGSKSWISRLTPAIFTTSTTKDDYDNEDESEDEWDEGCYVTEENVDIENNDDMGRSISIELDSTNDKPFISCLEGLPDELLLAILLRLPPSISQLMTLSLVSRRFYDLSQSPLLWSELFDSTPEYSIIPDLRNRLVASEMPPGGVWEEDNWLPSSPASHKPILPLSPSPWTPSKRTPINAIPVHYPTLYRSRRALNNLIRRPNPSIPPSRIIMAKQHTNAVYCVVIRSPWMITGSKDNSMRIWRLGDLPMFPGQMIDEESKRTKLVKTIEDAHEGSVLSVRFELAKDGKRGVIFTGSSDMTACLWSITFAKEIKVEKTGTFRGHAGGVLDIILGKTRLATCSKDATIRIYDRATQDHLFTCLAHTAPVNCLALNPNSPEESEEIVSASGDGQWIVWDMITGQDLRRGQGEGRGIACVDWEGGYIVTGDNDKLTKLYNASTGELLMICEGHTGLTRSVVLDIHNRMIVSGSYDTSVRIWDLDTGELIRRVQGGLETLVFGLAVNKARIVSVYTNGSIQVLTFGPNLPYRGLFA